MTVATLLQSVDTEIAKWKKVRSSIEAIFQAKPHRKPAPKGKHKMSKKGLAAIKAAQRKRWQKKVKK